MPAIGRRTTPAGALLALTVLGAAGLAACSSGGVTAPLPAFLRDLKPLSQLQVPAMVGSDIKDEAAAIRLGKAFFWDVQAGSDGVTACATCHFNAGADDRLVLHPGPNGRFDEVVNGQTYTPGAAVPLRSLKTDDAFGSAGIVRAAFHSTPGGELADDCTPDESTVFGSARQVTALNSPSASAAMFYRLQFWDGRASDSFNGVEPTGTAAGDGLTAITGASLASQAVGPVVNEVEMACEGRPLSGANSMGSRLLARAPLAQQAVDPTDSVLGGLSAGSGKKGLKAGITYAALIDEAFREEVASRKLELFGRIWGQAIAAYERTLVPDATPLDRYLAGQATALSTEALRGAEVFMGPAGCAECHADSEFSDATVAFAAKNGLLNRDGGDQGFHNIGVRPTGENLGRAAVSMNPAAANRGAFKTPGLRNVALTAPYFHDGGTATLEEVIQFYARGGDFPNPEMSSLMRPVALSGDDQRALVAFLRDGLTDCRARVNSAPFDHPSLPLPDGRLVDATGAGGSGSCN